VTVLPLARWLELAGAHAPRADELTAAHRERRLAGVKHAVEDFLFDYYGTRPSVLRRWHPGAGVLLEPGPVPHLAWRWYAEDASGAVGLDLAAYLADREETVLFVRRLLTATASRPAFTGCFGMHEWAMVYREAEHRHPLPLRLGRKGTDAVVEANPVVCSHFDAFRFFTPEAVALNRLQPTRADQVELEQPGCLHAAMDCHKWATKLGPLVPGDLALDCFALARDCRTLDMQASPYDFASYGLEPVAVETATGKTEYVRQQKAFADRAAGLRERLIACTSVLAPA
jgi:hypothetical protein